MQSLCSNQETVIVVGVPVKLALVGTSLTVTDPVTLVACGVNFVVVTVPVGAAAVPVNVFVVTVGAATATDPCGVKLLMSSVLLAIFSLRVIVPLGVPGVTETLPAGVYSAVAVSV